MCHSNSIQSSNQKQFGPYQVDGYYLHCETVFEVMGCFHRFCECQERKVLSPEIRTRGLAKREQDNYRRSFLQELGPQIFEVLECKWNSMAQENLDGAGDLVKTFFPVVIL